MALSGRHSASALAKRVALPAEKEHHVRKSLLLLAICAGAQVAVLAAIGAFGHGLEHQDFAVGTAVLGPGLAVDGAAPKVPDAGSGAAPSGPVSEAPTVGVLGTFLQATASGQRITAATVQAVTSPETVAGDSGALPVVPFPDKPVIPPDTTPPVPVVTPTATPSEPTLLPPPLTTTSPPPPLTVTATSTPTVTPTPTLTHTPPVSSTLITSTLAPEPTSSTPTLLPLPTETATVPPPVEQTQPPLPTGPVVPDPLPTVAGPV